jgi:hypothetical protein
MTWTGRVFAQALIYLLMSKKYITLSLFIVNVINSLAFYIFMLCSFKIITHDKGKILSRDFLLFLFFFIFIFYQTGFIANVLWKTGAIQYFWGITLLTVFYYYSIIRKKDSLLFGLFTGLVIGLYNEIFVCVSILLSLAYFFERRVYRQRINDSILAFFVACSIGGCILILAPGNYARLDHLSSNAHSSFLVSVMNLVEQIIFNPQFTLILLIMIFGFLFLIFTNKQVKKLKATIYSIALIISLFILTPVAKSYDLNQRVLLIYYVMFFILFMQQFYQNDSTLIQQIHSGLKKISCFFAILLVIQIYLIFGIYLSLYKFENNRIELISYYHSEKVSNPALPYIAYASSTVFLDDISTDKNVYNNQAFAEYYGFNSVAGKQL